MYPVASSTGENESGTTLRAYIERNVQPKNNTYAVITKGFRYSRMREGYVFCELFLSIICEIAEIKVLSTIIQEKINISLIAFLLLVSVLIRR